jgi:hypothetical protein
MKERPILFSAPMVQAILRGEKTQTRRRVAMPRKRDSFVLIGENGGWWPYQSDDGESALCNDSNEHRYACPYGVPGDRLWVRETWRITSSTVDEARAITEDIMSGTAVGYRATYVNALHRHGVSIADAEALCSNEIWRPSIHMPRWASRITLEITGVRVERLQDISRGDAMGEGCPFPNMASGPSPRDWFAQLWTDINGAGAWDANPWVWVIEFRRLS